MSARVPPTLASPDLYTPAVGSGAFWALPSCHPAGVSGVDKHHGPLPASISGARKGPSHTLLGETLGTLCTPGHDGIAQEVLLMAEQKLVGTQE